MEPPFLLRHRVALANWKPVLEALEDVMLQTSAMESVLEGQGQCSCTVRKCSSHKCVAPGCHHLPQCGLYSLHCVFGLRPDAITMLAVSPLPCA